MNNERRKRLGVLATTIRDDQQELNKLFDEVNKLIGDINAKYQDIKDNVTGEIEELRDEESEYYENMPESLQNGEKGQAASEAVEQLEAAIGWLESLDDLDELEVVELESEVAEPLDNAAAG